MSFKVKDAHWELMVSFMEENPSLATGRFSGPNGRASLKMLWGELTQKLNALGYGERSPEKWQKTWTDLKYIIKKKATNYNTNLNATGGGPPTEAPLNSYERRMLQILGDSFYKGAGSAEIAVPSSSKAAPGPMPRDTPPPDQENEHSYSYQPPQKRRRKNKIEDKYEETINILKEINQTVARASKKFLPALIIWQRQ
ncbi:hypothetical protein JTB14_034259 [Gonioctena quinquepunctata]|nr:hypothetical protein JTB14_034259 [Gonioctena quinquepunctata]